MKKKNRRAQPPYEGCKMFCGGTLMLSKRTSFSTSKTIIAPQCLLGKVLSNGGNTISTTLPSLGNINFREQHNIAFQVPTISLPKLHRKHQQISPFLNEIHPRIFSLLNYCHMLSSIISSTQVILKSIIIIYNWWFTYYLLYLFFKTNNL